MITIPTEPIGSIPRPAALIEAVAARDHMDPALDALYDAAIQDTIARFEATGSPVITDGEQRKYHNFWTYCVHGLPNMAPDGFKIPFSAGHTRRMPRLTEGPFRYRVRADQYLEVAQRYARTPIKQAVISPSALSLLYPAEAIPGYSRDQFIDDLLAEHEAEVRQCLTKGAHKVQIDFTEGRLAIKIDPTGDLLNSFIELNNLALARFTVAERARLGVHTCPGGDRDSTHSADVDYAELLPSLFQLKVGSFYLALAISSCARCAVCRRPAAGRPRPSPSPRLPDPRIEPERCWRAFRSISPSQWTRASCSPRSAAWRDAAAAQTTVPLDLKVDLDQVGAGSSARAATAAIVSARPCASRHKRSSLPWMIAPA